MSSIVLAAVLLLTPPPKAESLARAQELLDAGHSLEAAQLLDGVLASSPDDADALLLRSTARFFLGQRDLGEQDLRRCLEIDPGQRQALLNLAAVEMSRRDYDEAYTHLVAARDLDPSAEDNDINLGAVLLLMGRLEEASESFQRHIERTGGTGEAYYLVATNYAMAGYSALALSHLVKAIQVDEKIRLRVRSDANFAELARTDDFLELLERDSFVPPPGSLLARQEFSVPFGADESSLLNATLDALAELQIPYDRRVETTAEWALVWADFRIKVTRDPASGRGVVELSAPPAAFSPSVWHTRSDELFAAIERSLASYRRRKPRS